MALVDRNILDLSIRKVPLLKPLLSLIMGIIISAAYINTSIQATYLILCLVILLAVLIVLSFRKAYSIRNFQTLIYYLFFLTVGIYTHNNTKDYLRDDYVIQPSYTWFLGTIVDDPIEKEKIIRFPVSIHKAIDSTGLESRVYGKIMLTIQKDSVQQYYQYGDLIAFRNTIREVTKPKNPYEFDYAKYLSLKGIWHQGYIDQRSIIILEKDRGSILIAKSLALRDYLLAKFSRFFNDEEAYDVAVALLFGYRSQIDPSTIQAFKNTGTIHVLSVSGLHVSLVFVFLNIILGWLDRWQYGKYVRVSFILLFIWIYVVLTGMSPPILRSGIMISFLIVGQLSMRENQALNSLIGSAFIILLFSPTYLFDIGFQLSYIALLGILIGYPLLKILYTSQNAIVQTFLDVVYVSLVAQLFTLPFLLHYFGEFPVYFLLANVFIALPSAIMMYLGVILALSPFDFINSWVGNILEYVILVVINGLQFIEYLPGAVLKGIPWNIVLTSLLVISIYSFVIAWNNRNKFFFLTGWVLIVCIFFGSYTIQYTLNNRTHFRIYEVGKEIAIAYAEDGRCVLYSSLDSANHPSLTYAVYPELMRICSTTKMEFINIPNKDRQNHILEFPNHKIMVIEEKYDVLPNDVDVILWRKNNYGSISALKDLNNLKKVILDGSNTDKRIAVLQDSLLNNSVPSYILKNNFAYVWNE